MRSFSNIEKSGFHRGQYVGYAGGRVYRIVKTLSGRWQANRQNNVPAPEGPWSLNCGTLAELSTKLSALPDPDYAGVR